MRRPSLFVFYSLWTVAAVFSAMLFGTQQALAEDTCLTYGKTFACIVKEDTNRAKTAAFVRLLYGIQFDANDASTYHNLMADRNVPFFDAPFEFLSEAVPPLLQSLRQHRNATDSDSSWKNVEKDWKRTGGKSGNLTIPEAVKHLEKIMNCVGNGKTPFTKIKSEIGLYGMESGCLDKCPFGKKEKKGQCICAPTWGRFILPDKKGSVCLKCSKHHRSFNRNLGKCGACVKGYIEISSGGLCKKCDGERCQRCNGDFRDPENCSRCLANFEVAGEHCVCNGTKGREEDDGNCVCKKDFFEIEGSCKPCSDRNRMGGDRKQCGACFNYFADIKGECVEKDETMKQCDALYREIDDNRECGRCLKGYESDVPDDVTRACTPKRDMEITGSSPQSNGQSGGHSGTLSSAAHVNGRQSANNSGEISYPSANIWTAFAMILSSSFFMLMMPLF